MRTALLLLLVLLLVAPASADEAGEALAALLAGPGGRITHTADGWRTSAASIVRTDSGYLVRPTGGGSFRALRIERGLRLPAFDLVRTERGWMAGEAELLATDRGLVHRRTGSGDAARTYFGHMNRRR